MSLFFQQDTDIKTSRNLFFVIIAVCVPEIFHDAFGFHN
nr:MAG TPA: hypothetical protein [Caudoviricetes sp.]